MANLLLRTKAGVGRGRRLTILLGTAALLAAWPSSAYAEYETDAWGDKFKYGAYSTLVSNDLLAREFRRLVPMLADPNADKETLRKMVAELHQRFLKLTEEEVVKIIERAERRESLTMFDPRRSAVESRAANEEFMRRMAKYKKELEPVDSILESSNVNGFASAAIQFNAHRGLYNEGLGIPQNSVAGVVSAYVAGLRSVEFDVLETKDYVSVIAHDTVTNRLNGAYDLPPVTISTRKYDEIKGTSVDILNPLGGSSSTWRTSMRMQTTQDFLEKVNATTSGMTVYVDARNFAPVSVVKLFAAQPILGANAVIKVYPFEMGAGTYSLVAAYAERYANSNEKMAVEDIAKARPNLLLALGGVITEVTEGVTLTNKLNIGAKDFNWIYFKVKVAPMLPYTSVSQDNKFQTIDGKSIFSENELKSLEARTFLALRWMMDFSAVGNVRVQQVAMLPSLMGIVESKDVTEYDKMAEKGNFREMSALTDNLTTFYNLVMLDKVDVHLYTQNSDKFPLKTAWTPMAWGSSDRFPDFAFAKSSGTGIDQNTLRDFVYGMPGTAGAKDDYYAKKMRNTTAILAKIEEMKKQRLPFQYLTTDLPTDLRAAQMGLFGEGWPKEMLYRPNGIVIPSMTPNDIGKYNLPTWVTEVFGDARQIDRVQFAADLKAYNDLLAEWKKKVAAVASLGAYEQSLNVLVNAVALEAIGQKDHAYYDGGKDNKFDNAIITLGEKIGSDDTKLKEKAADFREKYGVNVDGSPVTSLVPYRDLEVLQTDDAPWDHF